MLRLVALCVCLVVIRVFFLVEDENKEEAPLCSFEIEGTRRHMVSPPAGGNVVRVCCNTTKGPLGIEVHPSWAPHGASRFLEMVAKNHFQRVPLFRCIKNFICQFGLNGRDRYRSIPDDPNWLPEGPSHRQMNGIKRFQRGYLAYAGAGHNSRSSQLIVALRDNERLGGGSPWEVPFGQVLSVGTLDRIYVGYGEKGPSQGRLMRRGVEDLDRDFPLLDYVTSCVTLP